MASINTHISDIYKLLGSVNYGLWKSKVQTILEHEDFCEFIESRRRSPVRLHYSSNTRSKRRHPTTSTEEAIILHPSFAVSARQPCLIHPRISMPQGTLGVSAKEVRREEQRQETRHQSQFL